MVVEGNSEGGCLFLIKKSDRRFLDEAKERWLLDERLTEQSRFQSLSRAHQQNFFDSKTMHTVSNFPTRSLTDERLPLMVIGALAGGFEVCVLVVSDAVRRSGGGTSSFCSNSAIVY